MNEISKIRQNTHEELTNNVVGGFERLDNNLLDKKAPKIAWFPEFDSKEDHIKINYLKKLASTMNNAAAIAQNERDALAKLMVLKDKQLEAMASQLRQNNMVVQDQVTKMNEQRQHFGTECARLNKRVKHLESQVKGKG